MKAEVGIVVQLLSDPKFAQSAANLIQQSGAVAGSGCNRQPEIL